MIRKRDLPEESTVSVNGVEFSHNDIFNVVEDFYYKVEHDELLKAPFGSVQDWPEHIKRLTHFWWLRFGGKPYIQTSYDPVSKHFAAGFNETFLDQWLLLFHQTLTEKLKPDQVLLWQSLSEKMGRSLSMRNDLLKKEFNDKEAERIR